MHEPLSRHWKLKYQPNATVALVRACAFVVILAVALVGVAVAVGELMIAGPEQTVAIKSQTTGSVAGARDAAPSSNDLFSGMPLP